MSLNTVKDFEAIANPRTRLVPMKVLRSFAPFFKNDIAGFPPATALQHYQNGDAVPVLPDGGQAEARPAGPAPAGAAGGAVTVTSSAGLRPGAPVIKTAAEDENGAGEGKKPAGPVEIPEEWEKLHHLKKAVIAKEIDPNYAPIGEEKPTEAASRVIQAEVERRAAEQQSQS